MSEEKDDEIIDPEDETTRLLNLTEGRSFEVIEKIKKLIDAALDADARKVIGSLKYGGVPFIIMVLLNPDEAGIDLQKKFLELCKEVEEYLSTKGE